MTNAVELMGVSIETLKTDLGIGGYIVLLVALLGMAFKGVVAWDNFHEHRIRKRRFLLTKSFYEALEDKTSEQAKTLAAILDNEAVRISTELDIECQRLTPILSMYREGNLTIKQIRCVGGYLRPAGSAQFRFVFNRADSALTLFTLFMCVLYVVSGLAMFVLFALLKTIWSVLVGFFLLFLFVILAFLITSQFRHYLELREVKRQLVRYEKLTNPEFSLNLLHHLWGRRQYPVGDD
ncbi:hypothetical protein LRP50_18440 [Enterovibrio sp. ZSDZ42]|uniref:Uncharacterized protein n=1 Tax=Enterovibrio gelatinilyticus TaxID=2899819 RepID=A0ABT5R4A5_9GAMM|nr:hypothetical protein [Enterovibrio sp. ZSDZ42]MDD1795111.1 hypothetical protein [Enterovibrio sp. ZSDZ42]